MATGSAEIAQLVSGVAAGSPSALRDFVSRYGGLASALARNICPAAQAQTAVELARRALQACVDELPMVSRAFVDEGRSLEPWVAVVCGRFLHEARAQILLESAARRAAELLPEALPSSKWFELQVYYRPSGWLSGDYYDAVERRDGSLLALVADVMGHGAPAALLVSAVKCAFRMNTHMARAEQVLAAMDATLRSALPPSAFVVASLLRLGPRRGGCDFANAGIEGAALILRSERRVEALKLPGQPLGLFEGATFGSEALHLRAGDCVFVCTDGVRDVTNEDDERFADACLPDLLREVAASASDLYGQLPRALDEFAGDRAWPDDACFLIAKAK